MQHHPESIPMGQPCETCAKSDYAASGNRRVELFSLRRFDFSGLQTSGEAELTIVRGLPVAAFTEGRLNVRIHARDILDAQSKLEVLVFDAAPSAEEPVADFVASSELTLARVIDGSAPALETASFEGSAGFVDVVVRGVQGGNAGDPCVATLSAELVGKGGLEHSGGRVVPVVSRRRFDFSDVSPSSSSDVVCARAIDVSAFRSGTLVTRVHDRTINGTANVSVRTSNIWPSGEQPETDFIDGTPAAVATIDGGSAPALIATSLTANFGPFVHVVVRANQPGGSSDTIRIMLSVELALRE